MTKHPGRRARWILVLAALGLLCQIGTAQASDRQRTCRKEPTDDLIQYGDLMSCSLDPGTDLDTFRFSGVAGEVVVIQAARLGGAGLPCLELLRPDGTSLKPKTCTSNSARLDATLDRNGQYRIRVSEYYARYVTPYSVVLERVGPASTAATQLDAGASVGGIISPLGEIDSFAFQAKAGDVISVVGTDTSATAAYVNMELIGPNGVRVIAGGGGDRATLTRTIVDPGIYTVLLYEYYERYPDMTYRLDYSCSGACPPLNLSRRYIDTASIETIGGTRLPESVSLYQTLSNKQTQLLIKDGSNGNTIKTIPVFNSTAEPLALAAIGDTNGDLVSELAVLGINLGSGSTFVWIVDPVTGDVSNSLYFNSGFVPLDFSKFEDVNRDGIADIGVMAVEKATGVTRLKITDGLTGAAISTRTLPK